MELGGNIELIGFSEHDGSDLVVIKKIVGTFTKNVSSHYPDFDSIAVALSQVHRKNDGTEYEITASITQEGAVKSAKSTDSNLYFALDSVLKKLERSL